MTILVTGCAGFIGSNFVLDWFAQGAGPVINLDKLTYAGNPANLRALKDNPEHVFVHGDIGDRDLVRSLLERHAPRAIVHFAAESHVDRSIHGPGDFVQTNILGTFTLLEEVDRKSTRLNSSHMSISYAVFCLKKKKTKSSPTPFLTFDRS